MKIKKDITNQYVFNIHLHICWTIRSVWRDGDHMTKLTIAHKNLRQFTRKLFCYELKKLNMRGIININANLISYSDCDM